MKNAEGARLIRLESTDRYQSLLAKGSGSYGIKSGHVVLKPEESVGRHSTGDREEEIVFLKGSGEARIGNATILKIEPSTVLYIPPKVIHDIKNTGTELLEYIFITARAEERDFN